MTGSEEENMKMENESKRENWLTSERIFRHFPEWFSCLIFYLGAKLC